MLTKQAFELLQLGTGGTYSLARDAIKHTVWDTRELGQAATDFTFFQQPVSSPWKNLWIKSTNETNLNSAGHLPNGQTFLAMRMSVAFIIPAGSTLTSSPDLAQACINILQSSYFDIVIAGRSYDYEIHGSQFLPRPVSISGDVAAGAFRQGDLIASGWTKLDPAPIFIDQLVNFSVIHKFGNPDTRIMTVLDDSCAMLDDTYGTMQIALEGFLTRAK